jgi:transcriptional regulator with XRE-family HTH domain
MEEAARLVRALAATLGDEVRAGRRRLRLRQRDLAARVGVHQSRISQIERGRGDGASLGQWLALGVALRRPFAASFSRPMDGSRAPADSGHLDLQEALLRKAAEAGHLATFELPTKPHDPSRSADVGVRDDRRQILILEEAWNTFGDVGQAVRSTHRKVAEAEQLAVVLGSAAGPYRVASVWVVRDSAANRALVARYPHVFAQAFPGSSRLWARCLAEATDPPREPGLIWIDPRTGRINEWRRPRRILG